MKPDLIWRTLALTMALLPLAAAGSAEAEKNKTLTIFAAASLTNVMMEAEKIYEEETGTDLLLNTASSSVLARQIESGADADIFLSANVKWMNYLVEAGALPEQNVEDLAVNRIVLIIPSGTAMEEPEFSSSHPFGATFSGRLSLGDPEHVPAGIYTREALTSLGWYTSLEDRLLPAANVRAALMAVESGEVEMGVVYSTDASVSAKVTVIGTFPAETHSPIRYLAGLIPAHEGEVSEEAWSFMEWISGPAGHLILIGFGFGLPEK